MVIYLFMSLIYSYIFIIFVYIFNMVIYLLYFVYPNLFLMLIHGGSMKSKPNCLRHICLMSDHIIIKLARYLENSTKDMIPTRA